MNMLDKIYKRIYSNSLFSHAWYENRCLFRFNYIFFVTENLNFIQSFGKTQQS